MKYYMQITSSGFPTWHIEWDTDSGLVSGWNSDVFNRGMKEAAKLGYVIGWRGRIECRNPSYSVKDFVVFITAALEPTWQVKFPFPLDQVTVRWPDYKDDPSVMY